MTETVDACTTCGAPATSWARDMKNETKSGDAYETWEPTGEPRAGCDDHPVRAAYIDAEGRVIPGEVDVPTRGRRG